VVRAVVSRLGLAVALTMLTLLGLLHNSPSRVSAQSQPLTIKGTIFNGSADGGDVAGLPVTLHRISILGPDDVQTVSNDEGGFSFDGVIYDPALNYGVSVRYQSAIYGTDVDLSAGSPALLTITVFDATTDDSVVSAVSASLLFASVDRANQTIAALEILRLANNSDRAYVPGNEPMQLLRFGLPDGATNLQLDTLLIGADFAQVDLGFALFASVPPGEHEIMFSYEFPYVDDEFTLEKSYRYGADTIRILAPFEAVAIRSDQLGPVESVTIGERPYQIIESTGIGRGEGIIVQIGGLPSATAVDRVSRNWGGIRFEWAAPVALVMLMFGLLLYGGFMKRRRAVAGDLPGPELEDSERETIHQMIDEVRESFESGNLNEDDYRRRLSVLNSQLTALSRNRQSEGQ
jgi:hypothetical protein